MKFFQESEAKNQIKLQFCSLLDNLKIILMKNIECIKNECRNYSYVKQLLTKHYDFTNTS